MPDQPNSVSEAVIRLAKYYAQQKELHLTNENYSGLEENQTYEDFTKWRAEKLKNNILVPVTVWEDLNNAEHFSKLAEGKEQDYPDTEKQEKKEKKEKHQEYGALHKKQEADTREKYRQIIDGQRKEIEASTGQQFNGETFLSDTVLNPEVREHMPNYHASALGKFKERYGDEEYAKLLEIEEQTVYKNADNTLAPEADPAFAGINKATEQEVAKRVAEHESEIEKNAKSTYAYSARRLDKEALRKQVELEYLVEFVKNHPEKAAAYAQDHRGLAIAVLVVEATGEALSGKTFSTPSEREMAEKDILARKIEYESGRPDLTWEGQPEKTPKTQSPPPPGIQSLGGGYILPFPSGTQQLSHSAPSPSSASIGSNLGDEGGQPDSTSEGSQDTRNRRRGTASGGSPLGSLAKQGASTLVKAGARALLLNPAVLIPTVLTVLCLFAVIVVIYIFLSNENTEPVPTTQTPLRITKTGPVSVANGDPITYEITVSYPGTASDIVVTDPIPENSEFKEATGVFTCNNDPCDSSSTSVTWHAKDQGGVAPSGAPISTGSTIHNLGFGPSDGARIDNFIRSLRPSSPIIGHGTLIVRLAKEFNLDPLMIVILLNESEFCTTGVVSPPTDYNCGGILWSVAQAETDTARWHASAGPEAYSHIFTYVPSIPDGMGLFFDYSSASFYQGLSLPDFYAIYNPCSDSDPYGLGCGAQKAHELLNILQQYSGPPCTSGPDCYVGSGGGASFQEMVFHLTVKPKGDNSYIINQASAQIIK